MHSNIMDFLDPKKKRSHQIRLAVGYMLMAVALGIMTVILVITASGYGLDPKTGAVVQNGLIFVDAHPESANVFIDGVEKGQTDARLVVPAGLHTLELKRSGYRSWQRQFDAEGSVVKRFAYPFLFPEKLSSKDIEIYGTAPGLSTGSPDRHWLVVQQPNSITNFEVIDLNTKTNPITTISLPANLLSSQGVSHSLELVEWASDNRRLLVKHNYEGGNEFIVIDREVPAESFNINKIFPIPINNMTLRDKRFDEYYLWESNGGVLRRADLRSREATPILTRVASFKPHGSDMILFISDEKIDSGNVTARIWDNSKIYDLRQLPVSKTYLIDFARFDNKWFIAIGGDQEHKVYIYRDPFDALKRTPSKQALPVSVLKVHTAQYLSFSANARFIAIQGGSEFAVYDAENNDQFRYDTKLPIPAGHKASWMDGHRLSLISQEKAVIFDFDGTNQQILSDANPAYKIFYNRDFSAMFTIASSRQVTLKPALIRTELKVQ